MRKAGEQQPQQINALFLFFSSLSTSVLLLRYLFFFFSLLCFFLVVFLRFSFALRNCATETEEEFPLLLCVTFEGSCAAKNSNCTNAKGKQTMRNNAKCFGSEALHCLSASLAPPLLSFPVPFLPTATWRDDVHVEVARLSARKHTSQKANENGVHKSWNLGLRCVHHRTTTWHRHVRRYPAAQETTTLLLLQPQLLRQGQRHGRMSKQSKQNKQSKLSKLSKQNKQSKLKPRLRYSKRKGKSKKAHSERKGDGSPALAFEATRTKQAHMSRAADLCLGCPPATHLPSKCLAASKA